MDVTVPIMPFSYRSRAQTDLPIDRERSRQPRIPSRRTARFVNVHPCGTFWRNARGIRRIFIRSKVNSRDSPRWRTGTATAFCVFARREPLPLPLPLFPSSFLPPLFSAPRSPFGRSPRYLIEKKGTHTHGHARRRALVASFAHNGRPFSTSFV